MAPDVEPLVATHVLEYPYTRSVGPVIGRFLAALKDGRIEGVKTRDGRVLACGGLLSVLKGQKEVFFFDVSNSGAPKFISSADPPQSAIADEFYSLADGGFLVTMMGGAQGHHPGRIAEFGKDLKLVAEYPQAPPDDGFNPHGISVRPEMNLMVTSDFICPSTTLHAVPGDL